MSLKESLRNKAGDVTEVRPEIRAPAGWRPAELRFTFVAGGRPGTYRRAVYIKEQGDRAIALTLLYDEARASDAASLAPRILGSVRLGPGS
jgi:hypothetical protein